MNVDCFKNGEIQLIVTPTDAVELAVLEEMKLRADSGRPIRIRKTESGFVIAVEK